MMAPTSTTRWSKTAGAGGIENMRQKTRCWKGFSKKRERRGKECGPIRSRCRRGRGGRGGRLPSEVLARTRGERVILQKQ
jgi:hypothetical protein